ncbi:MAG TPA: CHAT domain-containing protein [Kofleriaceae bacterium]|nr:CHAT domain-containing protein [Kofleriaceae bacterium]
MATCRQAWHQIPTPEHAADLLRALRESDAAADPVEFEAIATVLAAANRAGPAHAALGEARRARNDPAGARREFETACIEDEAQRDDKALARDASALAGACRDQRDFAAARAALARSKRAAEASADDGMVRYVEMVDTDLARLTGDYAGADEVLRRLERTEDRSRLPWIHFEHGVLYLTWGKLELARHELGLAVQSAGDVGSSESILGAAHANLGSLARERGDYDDADRHFAAAEKAYGSNQYTYELLLNRGLTDLARGDAAQAAARLRTAAAMKLDGEWTWLVPFHLGRVEAKLGNDAAAEVAFRRSMESVAVVRASSGAYEPTVIATHRMPHEALIGLLAGQGRWTHVLAVLVDLDARHMIAAVAEPARLSIEGELVAARTAQPISPVDHDISKAPPIEAIVGAWSKRRLIAVVPTGEQLCRVTLIEGKVDGSCIGGLAALEADALALEGAPDNAAVAERLGAALIPVNRDRERLDVLLVGPIARAPLGALRNGSGLIAAERPLVRVLGLIGHARGPWQPGAVVLGAPTPDLAGAAEETRRVAQRLNTTARIGGDASRHAIELSRSQSLLHVAAHATLRAEGPVLELNGGAMTLAEIAGVRPAARVVVLGTCDSATGRDDSGWGSLASAFLIAGAEAVVATSWRVPDTEVPTLMDQFYDAGGATDPARALAAAQKTLATKLPARTWAAFAVIAAPPAI